MKKINFVCPECGEDLLDEVNNAEVRYTIIGLEKQNNGYVDTESDHSDPIIDLQEVTKYICACCLKELAGSPEELYNWLEEHEMLEEET